MTRPCVFCAIVAGDAPASIVHGDDAVVAFMDIRPVNAGHVLVVPRQHAVSLLELDEETAGRMTAVGMRIAGALRASGVRFEGFNLFLANGEVAGQEVFHVHLHVIPRFARDGFGLRFGPDYGRLAHRSDLDGLAQRVRRAGGWE
jgi:histidine triad (HIT) family protein